MLPALALHQTLAIGTTEAEVDQQVERLEKLGWKAAEDYTYFKTVGYRVVVKPLVSMTAIPAAKDSPRVKLLD